MARIGFPPKADLWQLSERSTFFRLLPKNQKLPFLPLDSLKWLKEIRKMIAGLFSCWLPVLSLGRMKQLSEEGDFKSQEKARNCKIPSIIVLLTVGVRRQLGFLLPFAGQNSLGATYLSGWEGSHSAKSLWPVLQSWKFLWFSFLYPSIQTPSISPSRLALFHFFGVFFLLRKMCHNFRFVIADSCDIWVVQKGSILIQ